MELFIPAMVLIVFGVVHYFIKEPLERGNQYLRQKVEEEL